MTARAGGESGFADVTGLDSLEVRPPATPPRGTVVVPGSKSLTNRALVLAGLADGRSRMTGALDADDTRLMVAALRRCGVSIEVSCDATTLVVDGLGGAVTTVDDASRPLEVGTAGTVARFLTAVLAASPVTARLDGTQRMRERPIAGLFDALAVQGAGIVTHKQAGFLPATITGTTLTGGEVVLARPASSQVVSALVLAGLLAAHDTRIVLTAGTPASPYVDMTLEVVQAFGGHANWDGDDNIRVAPGGLGARDPYVIEPDASAATYPLALAATTGGDVRVEGLGATSLQGDVAFVEVLGAMGATTTVAEGHIAVAGTGHLRGIDVDLGSIPDTALTLAVVALHAHGPTRIRGIEVVRHHETDRIVAAATELRKLGARVVEHDDGLDITPPPRITQTVAIDTWQDHRMAMAFSLAGAVTINDPGCVAKTWPGWFALLDWFGMVT